MKLTPLHKAMLEAGAEIISREFKKGLSDLLPDLKEVKDTYSKTKESVDREAIAKELHAYIDKLKVSKKGDTLLTIATLLRNFVKEVDAEQVVDCVNTDNIGVSPVSIGGIEYVAYKIPRAAIVDQRFVIKFDNEPETEDFLDRMLSESNLLLTVERDVAAPDPINVTILLRMMNNDLGYAREGDKYTATLTVPITTATNFTKHMPA